MNMSQISGGGGGEGEEAFDRGLGVGGQGGRWWCGLAEQHPDLKVPHHQSVQQLESVGRVVDVQVAADGQARACSRS